MNTVENIRDEDVKKLYLLIENLERKIDELSQEVLCELDYLNRHSVENMDSWD